MFLQRMSGLCIIIVTVSKNVWALLNYGEWQCQSMKSTVQYLVLFTLQGVPSLNSTVTVTIRMQQMTGSSPVFQSDFPQNFNIVENFQLGTVLATVSAWRHSSSRTKYYIAGGNVNPVFAINEMNAMITIFVCGFPLFETSIIWIM